MSATSDNPPAPQGEGFLGALLLCGVCDRPGDREGPDPSFLGALLLCGVCDTMEILVIGGVAILGALLLCGVCDPHLPPARDRRLVSRSSSALWCLRLPEGV